MATHIKNKSNEVKEAIIEAYKNNMSLREIEKVFGATRPSVSKFLEE